MADTDTDHTRTRGPAAQDAGAEHEPPAPARRRRSDARRSIDAILGAARTVLAERPEASMEEIAAAAGVTRQTVYAHFPSRDALFTALIDAAGADTVAALDAAGLDTLPPAEALRRFLDISWNLVRHNTVLLVAALARTPTGSEAAHRAGTDRLERIIRRGQGSGDFDAALPAEWLADAVVGLARTAAEQVAAGRLSSAAAATVIQRSARRLCGIDAADPPPDTAR
ncbi:TetR/AcrR family transcriptional regulator [Hamadaea tsunoensis]|uniref:TetR/AcrR family transcriptional regulator n=1 Tax=Hamadaea tsunoensis TaxID=53368 RepID=UPI0004043B65|nr:TetR/AcrR family transcriptional regulator [Hamadaea tsunoensis]